MSDMQETTNEVIAIYDVRGIQDYVFRTAKVRDAIGASAIVENIISEALEAAIKEYEDTTGRLNYELSWVDDKGYIPYDDGERRDVEVLYIGGGNAFVKYSAENLCVAINRLMSKYILEHTYSLQLATVYRPKTDNYSEDYRALQEKLQKVKADMVVTKPVGALPIMKVETKTGYPLAVFGNVSDVSTESHLKKGAEKKKREDVETAIKVFDTYTETKGADSMLAVIHIDGNNMGIRIRELIEDKNGYKEAVNMMREISHNITQSYVDVYKDMEEKFNCSERQILKILTAGDDITYVAKAKVAIASVEYFCNQIKEKSMLDVDNEGKYKFSVCAGISFMHSHFPFSIAYDVAEACCDSAKKKAKAVANGGEVGNWFDFQYCKNIQTRNLEQVREQEYRTASGETLIRRPYQIGAVEYANLIGAISYFQEQKNLPRSHAKTLRNMYSLGRNKVDEFASFLNSRGWKMPNKTLDMYDEYNVAMWYDALELIDDYVALVEKKEGTDE